MRLVLNVLSVVLVAVLANAAIAEEWPKWRGPRADGISRETGLLESWPEEGPKKVWSAEVGVGFASPIAIDGKVYLLTLVDDKQEVLQCFDADTGKVLWSQAYDGGWTGQQFPGSRATPWIEDGRIYTYGGKGDLVCRDLSSGQKIWHINVPQRTGVTKFQQWGIASTPLIVENAIYVQNGVGGPIAVAVNKTDGKLLWQSEARGLAGYAQIVLADVQGTKQLIVLGGDTVYGMDPATGKTIWQEPWETKYEVNAATPIVHEGHLFITSGYDSGSMMLKLSPTGAQKLWEYRDSKGAKHIRSRFQGVILENGVLYANSEGILRAMSWPDGAIKWEARPIRLGNGGSIVRVGDKFVALSERGELMLIQTSADGARKISSVKLAEGDRNWATPLIYRGKLYVKTMEELICLDIAGK